MIRQAVLTGVAAMTLLAGAAGAGESTAARKPGETAPAVAAVRPEIYAPVTLAADLSSLSASERQMLGLFIEAGQVMDDLYWRQTYDNTDWATGSGLQPYMGRVDPGGNRWLFLGAGVPSYDANIFRAEVGYTF